MNMIDTQKLIQAMGELEEDTVMDMLHEVMNQGGQEAQQAMDACQKGMDEVGRLFEEGEYFVGDLIYAGELMTEAVDILKDALIHGEESTERTSMILCTVKNDLHDIGKNIVRSMLEAAGFQVIDLGIDVAPETIVEKVRETGVKIVALSGVLTLALDSMKETVEALKEAGLRDSVKVIVGGAPVYEGVNDLVGSDAWAHSPQTTIRTCKEWSAMA